MRRQNQLDELIRWSVLLVCGDGPDTVTLGGHQVLAVLRQPKGGYGEGPPWRIVGAGERFVIRRLLNPRDEGVDIDADGYEAAMAETIASPPKRRKPGTAAPTRPSEAWLRAHRSPESGLLLIHPLAREADLEGPDGVVRHRFLDIPTPIVGIGISFPAGTRAGAEAPARYRRCCPGACMRTQPIHGSPDPQSGHFAARVDAAPGARRTPPLAATLQARQTTFVA